MKKIMAFDKANNTVDYYTLEHWKIKVNQWRRELVEDGDFNLITVQGFTDAQTINAIYNGEISYKIIEVA